MANPKASKRLIKWATRLNEYDIEYQSHTTIKDQALVDFLMETYGKEGELVWKIFVDGSTTSQGRRVGILLVSP